MVKSDAIELGSTMTFHKTACLFYIVGLGFGTSYSLTEVDCIDWVKTNWMKKIFRGVLGCGIAELIFWSFNYLYNNAIKSSSQDSVLAKYCFTGAFPYIIVPLLIYGPFLVFCQRDNLVDS